ncbi:hypothetical protein B0J17DRAFT_721233 [Rhizoctonia solani]|nr:hypothetical protein B0J17DRAFT_721233 [Rhizoctonia solani]
MPPLGWRKSVDGAKGKKTTNQNHTDTTPVFNKPPPVPGLTGIAIEALGGTSLGLVDSTQDPSASIEDNEAMDIDEPSTGDSTPAPGASAIPTGSSSNAEMTPPVRSIKLKLKEEGEDGAVEEEEEAEDEVGEVEKSVMSPSVSPEEESPVEEPGSPESEESSVMGEDEFPRTEFEDAPDQTEEGDTTIDADGEDDADGEIDADGEVEMDPDATVDSDEEQLLDMDMPDQTIDSDAGADADISMMSMSSKRLTARQAAMVAGSEVNHVMLPEATGRKAQRTEAEIALRRSETARKRKHQDAQRLEDEKTETINRLLKKQSARARNKKALDTPVNEAAAPGEETPVAIVDNRPRIPCFRWVTSARDTSPALSLSVPGSTAYFPYDASASLLAASAQPVIRPVTTCAVSGCTAQRKYRLPGAPNFETGACGMDHLKLLKTQAV